jgi:predicted DNA-binding protein (MmcQ/YjbR family)
MNIEKIRDLCLSKKDAVESFPFDNDTLVFKVKNKMFALLSLDDTSTLNLKCNPAKAVELREKYSEITPGYHMNKKHWNTVVFNSSLPENLIKELIDHSYNLVIRNLPKKERDELGG